MDIRPVTEIPDLELCHAMNDAFSDYGVPLQLPLSGFQQMMKQRGMVRAHSLAAVDAKGIAAIWLVSVRSDRAYLISSGTRPAYRSRGIARRLANESLTNLRDQGIRTFQTEVMDGNDVAAALYFGLGMSVSRHLDCYELPIRKTVQNTDAVVVGADWVDIRHDAPALRSWEPSWQNDDESLASITGDIQCARIDDEKGLAAYAAVIPQSATLAQIAVRPDCRRNGLATALIAHCQGHLPDRPLRVLNVEADNPAFSGFMQAMAAGKTVGQRELFMRFESAGTRLPQVDRSGHTVFDDLVRMPVRPVGQEFRHLR